MVVSLPGTWNWSLTVMGRPWSGPRRAAGRASSLAARARAEGKRGSVSEFVWGG